MKPNALNPIGCLFLWAFVLGLAPVAYSHSLEMWADTTMAATYAIDISTPTHSARHTSTKCVWTPEDIEDSWRLALVRAQAAFRVHRHRLSHVTKVIVVNYDVRDFHPWTGENIDDRLRVYAVGSEWTLQERHWVSHARRSGTGCPRIFSNVPESNYSSRGSFMTAARPHRSPNFGYPALRLIGLEAGTNDNVTRRAIIFHSAKQGELDLSYSLGCLMTRPKVNTLLLPKIAGGQFLFVHSSYPTS